MDESTPTRRFAESLRAIRKSRGLSAQKLADIPGFPLTRGKIAKLENSPNEPIRLDDAAATASALGLPLEQMLDGTAPYQAGLSEWKAAVRSAGLDPELMIARATN